MPDVSLFKRVLSNIVVAGKKPYELYNLRSRCHDRQLIRNSAYVNNSVIYSKNVVRGFIPTVALVRFICCTLVVMCQLDF